MLGTRGLAMVADHADKLPKWKGEARSSHADDDLWAASVPLDFEGVATPTPAPPTSCRTCACTGRGALDRARKRVRAAVLGRATPGRPAR